MGKMLYQIKNKRFGRLFVIDKASGRGEWFCRCDCGKTGVFASSNMRNGSTKSCGCLGAERRLKAITKHGLTGSLEYKSWSGMKKRCLQKSSKAYRYYGGRGITICKRWRNSLLNFVADMGPRPSPAHSLDRVDNSKGYAPGNCRWATFLDQARNKRTSRRFTYMDQTLSLPQWAKEFNLPMKTVYYNRANNGWPIGRIFKTPIKVSGSNQRPN